MGCHLGHTWYVCQYVHRISLEEKEQPTLLVSFPSPKPAQSLVTWETLSAAGTYRGAKIVSSASWNRCSYKFCCRFWTVGVITTYKSCAGLVRRESDESAQNNWGKLIDSPQMILYHCLMIIPDVFWNFTIPSWCICFGYLQVSKNRESDHQIDWRSVNSILNIMYRSIYYSVLFWWPPPTPILWRVCGSPSDFVLLKCLPLKY